MEIFRSHGEVKRRDRVDGLINRVDELVPRPGGIPSTDYESAFFAPRARLSAYQGDLLAKRVLENFNWLTTQEDNVHIRLNKVRKLITLKGNRINTLRFDNKYKVLSLGPGNVNELDQSRANLNMEDLLKFICSDLSNGRMAWSEILEEKRAKFCDSSEVLDKIKELVSRLDSDVVVAKKSKSADRDIIDIYAPEIFKYDFGRDRLVNSYKNVDYGAKHFGFDNNGNEVFSFDLPSFGFRVRELPKMNNVEASEIIEESFGDFMSGDGNFELHSRRLGYVTVLGYKSELCPALSKN